MKKSAAIILILYLIFTSLSGQVVYRHLEDNSGLSAVVAGSGIEKPVYVRIIYDNYSKREGIRSDWGFSLLLEGLEKVILFDTGAKPDIFKSNFKSIGLDAGIIDVLILTHEHGDHTGGIPGLVEMRKEIPVIMPQSFSARFKEMILKSDLEPVLVLKPAMICKNLYTSGEFSGSIPEQALVINTKNGLVVITGCSHPGIIQMLKQIRSDFNKNIYMVFGGFHLLQKSEKEMIEIIAAMKQLGVVKCGATHCTGDNQIKLFRDSFGDDFVELGAGNTIILN